MRGREGSQAFSGLSFSGLMELEGRASVPAVIPAARDGRPTD